MSSSSQSKVAKMGSFLAVAGIASLAAFGTSMAPSADAAVTFGANSSPGSIIQGGLASMVPKPVSMMDKYLVPGLLNMTYIGVAITKPTQIVVSANASLMNPFGSMALPLGVVGLNVLLDDVTLATVTTTPLTIAAGIGPLSVNATVDVADGETNPALKNSIKNLVTGFFGGVTPNGPPPKLVISGINLAGTPLGLDPIVIPTQIKPSGPIKPTDVTAGAGKPPVIGLAGLINPAINFTMPTLNKVTLKAVTGAQLTGGVGFSWNNPLNVGLDIPYVTIDVALNGTRLLTVGVDSLHLAPGNMTAETFVDLKFNNDPAASAQLAALVNDFLAGNVNHILSIGNFTFGTKDNTTATGVLLNTLFSGIEINLPLLNINTIAIQQMIASYLQPYIPIDISKLGSGTGPSLTTYLQALAISTAPGHTLLIEPKIQLPLPFELDLNIPYFALDINLDNSMLGQFFLANLVGTGSGQVGISVGIGLVFREPAPEIPPTVAKLVTGLTTGSSLDILAGVSNIAIGISPADAVNTLNNLNIAVPISSLITGSISTGNLLQDIMAQTNVTIAPNAVNIKVGSLAQFTIHEASIAVLPSNMVTAGINLDMFLGLPVIANIGYFGLQVSLDDANLAGVGLTTGLNYGGGMVQMNAGVAISVGTGPEISGKVASLVNAIIAHQPVSSSVGVGGIVIGQSADDLINALSQVKVSIPLGGFLGGNAPALSSGFLDSILAQLGLSLTDLSLSTIPNAGLQVGAKASFSNPIPISVSVPFIGISGGLDRIDVVDVGLNNLALSPGPNALQAQVALNFNNAAEAQSKVATFVGEILGGQLGNTPEALTVHNLRIGASPSDYFDLLSQIDISIPSKDILNKPNMDLLLAHLGLNPADMTNNLLNNLQIGAISANLNRAPVMELGTSLTVSNVSLNAAVNIGYFGIDLALDTHALARVDVPSITISTANNQLTLAIKASVTIQDTPEIQTDIANLVDFFMANSTTSPVNSLVISRPLLGVSASDSIQTFALIKVPVGLSDLLLKARVYVSQLLAGLGGLNTDNLAISGLALDLNSPSVIGIQGGVQVKNLTLPIDVSISYVGVSLGLDSTPLADVTVPSFTLSSANNALSVNFQALVDVKQGQELSGQIAKLVGSLLYPGQVTPPTNVVIYDPVFGGDKDHLFHILSKIRINIALAPYLQKIGAIINGGLAGGSNLLAGLDIGSLIIDLNSPQTIGIDADISLKNITIPAEIKLNYVGVNVAIDTVGLAQIAVPSFSLKPSNGALAISAHVDIEILPSDQLTAAITNLISGVLKNQTTPATNLVISGAVFGGSPTNVFTILQSIAIPINVAPFINQIPALIAGQGSLLDRVAIGELIVDLNSPQTIGVDTSVSIKNVNLPAQIKLNYVGANIGIGEVPLVKLGIPKFAMNPNNGNLDISLHLDLALQESQALTQTINGLAQVILAGKPIPTTTLLISGAAFGGSPSDVFTFLQGVKIPLDITAYLNQALTSINSPGAPSLLGRIGISDLVVDLNSPQVIGIDASVLVKNITLPAQIKLNYVGANVAINSIPLAQVSVPQFSLAPQNGDLLLKVHVNLALLSSPELSKTISGMVGAILGNQTLPQTDLIISGATFGASPTNYFTIIQGVIIPIDISPYIAKIGGMLGGAGSSLNGLSLSGLTVNLNQAPTIGIDVNVVIRNLVLPAKLNVGYVGFDIGINSVPLVEVAIPKIELGSSGTDLTISTHIDLTLSETDASQSLVAALVNAIVAGQLPQGTIMISDIAFGPSKNNVYTILQGVQIPIPISKILSFVPALPGTTPGSILDKLSLQSADINMKNPPRIGADVDIALLGFQFDAKLLLNYVSISAFLDQTPLATVSVPGISLASGNNQVELKIRSLVDLASGGEIQSKIAAIAAQLMGNGGAQNVNLVVSKIAFGSSAGNVFHILDKVQVSVPLAPYLQQLAGIIGGVAGGNGAVPPFNINKLDISAPGANDLSIAVGASIGGIGSKISVQMPYVGLKVSAGGAGFVYPAINNFQLSNGNIALTLDLPFQPAARQIVASLSTPVSQLLFSTVGQVPGSVVVNSIEFGASPSQAFDIAAKIGLEIQLNSIFQKAQAYINAHNPLHVNVMNTVLTTTGIQATITVPGAPLSVPLKMNFPISLSAYYKGGSPFIGIQATSISLDQSPWSLGANIQTIQPAFSQAMDGILPNALQWKNALQDVTIGGLSLGEFTALGELRITPPAVTLWSPITIPLDRLKLHLVPLGMDFSAVFDNLGPLLVDLGTINVLIKDRFNSDVIEIQNLGGPIRLTNGRNDLALNGSLKFNILQLPGIIISLLNPSGFKFIFNMRTSSGQPMPWLQDALNGVPATIFNNLLPILAKALSNIRFTI
ncbi:hypothetical protein BX616_008127 [Lobosporangium transversale]|uniref:Uncharacterized protein n=1 Tax=Lobosporangium transversale TaxID=64571 RepID=A0A1Y2GU83_9FUNG|nr:hypothetical protein BCR41DRAFT_23750 [Lobosporangium transversale]KAF9914527.1 hypothetical protein BX616_008127 [Lobosporangium transversale]ORZ21909.1 hypothetical protein BCR41DRAFT_23750 [Lobosporangium transversale]|eukprot:XP_021883160.1 hypothetical protein BCR41DRAFT_23750 [Lobosporangium transversale]